MQETVAAFYMPVLPSTKWYRLYTNDQYFYTSYTVNKLQNTNVNFYTCNYAPEPESSHENLNALSHCFAQFI